MRWYATALYFLVATVLTLFGLVALFSIGAPFFVTGLAMFGLWPLRQRHRALFFALLPMPILFSVGYVSVAPISCTTTAVSSASGIAKGQTSCSALFGTYSSQPSLAPALTVGIIVAAVVGTLIYLLATRSPPWRTSHRRSDTRQLEGASQNGP